VRVWDGKKEERRGYAQVIRREDEVFCVLLTLRMFWSEQSEVTHSGKLIVQL
jgi:hypothetical protein